VRNPTTIGWSLAIGRRARAQGCRVLLGGVFGNSTISWNGWSQTADHLLAGRLLTAYRQWQLFYRLSPYSRRSALRRLIIEPLWAEVGDSSAPDPDVAPWRNHAAILPEFAASMRVEARAREFGHHFRDRLRRDERARSLAAVDYLGDWLAAEKAVTGVELRDPTADIDVVSFCFGVPPEQYLAEGIDRSLIRRAMWDLLPEAVLTGRLGGIHSADWYEKLSLRRDQFAAELPELSETASARRSIDFARLERAIRDWPLEGWHTSKVADEYHFAFTRGIAGARFLRWFESSNRQPQASER
jgi:asparagine synthase (glutamine-hydrolysing)